MAQLEWDGAGEKKFETGTDRGVLYLRDVESGDYDDAEAWNGITAVTESPSGAEPNKQYADNIVYANIVSAEEFSATIEAFTWPDKFALCDGTAEPSPGVTVGQQNRRSFGFSYRTKIGDDLLGQDAGYKIHLVWNCLAAPSEKAYATISDSPEPTAFSWEVSSDPTAIGEIEGVEYKPTCSMVIDSTKVDETALRDFLEILWGGSELEPKLPSPKDVIEHFLNVGEVEMPPSGD